MNSLKAIESRRLLEQARLDSSKTAQERNLLGQFATPPALAVDIVRFVRGIWTYESPIRYLDPAIGTGSFYSALRLIFPADEIDVATGVELDPIIVDAARSLWRRQKLKIIAGDFTVQRPPCQGQRFNLVLTNPPYVRHHHLDRDEKRRLQAAVFSVHGLKISGLAGLYCYFLLLSHEWMEDGGIAVWLIPTEFMDVNYGITLKRYLTEKVKLLRIHRFCPSDVQFADALVTSAIVVFQKSTPRPRDTVRFSFGASLASPERSEQVPLSGLRSARKWSKFPTAKGAVARLHQGPSLGDLFNIKRGLATGSNTFFVLERSRALELGIPNAFLKPILPSPRHLCETVVTAAADGYPDMPRQFCLIDCGLPEDRLRSKHPRFWEYLQGGRQAAIHSGYLASRRSPWYSQENRPPAPFLCTYMGRGRENEKPFRFIWNKSNATAANVYLLLYPKEPLISALREDPNLQEVVFRFLEGIDASDLVGEGRVYGGGLHKVEPKELGRVSAMPLLGLIPALGPTEQTRLPFA